MNKNRGNRTESMNISRKMYGYMAKANTRGKQEQNPQIEVNRRIAYSPKRRGKEIPSNKLD